MEKHSLMKVQALLTAVFRNQGFTLDHAELLAANCATAEADGSHSHGLFRIRHYVDTMESGYANPTPRPVLEDVAPAVLRVDGDNGFALISIELARKALMDKARKNGLAALYVRNSHHLGALYLDIEAFIRAGFVALAFVNSEAAVVPPGARQAIYGTNPMAFGAPRSAGEPVVFDQSSSTTAFGEVQMAARENRVLPDGTGVNSEGRETGDPRAILDGGALLTFGGHKGASIALMVEILCAALVGGDFSHEVEWSDHPGAMTARTGETIILIDPTCGSSKLRPFASRLDQLAQALAAHGQTRIPGERRFKSRSRAVEDGIEIGEQTWAQLQRLADTTAATA